MTATLRVFSLAFDQIAEVKMPRDRFALADFPTRSGEDDRFVLDVDATGQGEPVCVKIDGKRHAVIMRCAGGSADQNLSELCREAHKDMLAWLKPIGPPDARPFPAYVQIDCPCAREEVKKVETGKSTLLQHIRHLVHI